MKSKLASANKLKEVFLRESSSQQEKRRKGEEERERERLEKYRNNLEKIEKGREKTEEQKSAYVFRIQKKTLEKLREAKERKRLIHSTEEQENEEAHMEEWNQYKAKLMRKYEGQKKSPPDHLYQEFKEKNSWLQRIYSEMKQQSSQQTPETAKPQAEGRELKSHATVRAAKTSHRKAEYFGVHEADMLKKTVGDLAKMRQFVD